MVTIHQRPKNCQLGMQFVHNWLRKRPYALCKSCRGSKDLQLWYSNVCPLHFNFLEKNSVKVCQSKLFLVPGAPERAPSSRVAAPRFCWARTPRPALVRRSARRGTISRQSTFRPSPLVPRAARAQAGMRRPRRPTSGVAAVLWPRLAHTATPSHGAQGNTPTTALLTFKCRPAYARAHCGIAGPLPPRHG
jgi:hypothetical protein